MLIPEFPRLCNSLITKLLVLSRRTSPCSDSPRVSYARGVVGTTGYNSCLAGPARHWLCQLLLLGKNDVLHRTLHAGVVGGMGGRTSQCHLVPCSLQASPNCCSYSVFHKEKDNCPLTNSELHLPPGPRAKTAWYTGQQLIQITLVTLPPPPFTSRKDIRGAGKPHHPLHCFQLCPLSPRCL